MVKLTTLELTILRELYKHVESEFKSFARDGDMDGVVYLSNCKSSGTREFAGVLASLTKKGFYSPSSECFGNVHMSATSTLLKLNEEVKPK